MLLAEFQPIFVCLQETMLGDSPFSPPRGYSAVLSTPNPAGGHHGGSAILCRHDVPSTTFKLQTPLQATALQIHLERRYTICNIYLPPNDVIPRGLLDGLLRQLPRPFILLGDMNGWHPQFGGAVNNPRGDMLASVVEDWDLCVLNTGDPTHFHIQTGTLTAIDLTMTSPDCFLDFNWNVLNDLRGSDHYPILIKSVGGPPAPRCPRWCLGRADWPLFKVLSVFNRGVGDFNSVDEAEFYFTTLLYESGVKSIPRTTGSFTRRPVPWWNGDCAAARSASKAAYSRFHRDRRNPSLKEQYKRTRAKYRWVLKNARKNSWAAYVNTINSSTPITQVWKRVKKIQGKYSPLTPQVLRINGNTVSESQEVATAFADHFFNVCRRDPSAPFFNDRQLQERSGLDFRSRRSETYNVPFSLRELKAALHDCKDSAPGHDGLVYSMFHHLKEESLAFLLDLINRIWEEGQLPAAWKQAVILPIPKPGKDHSVVSNFRPISLTSCSCKLFEKMVNTRLVYFLEKGGWLSKSQCGFRKFHSTTDSLLRLESAICDAYACRQHQVAVFFDLEKAYDTAWRFGILKALHSYGLRGRLPFLIRNFLEDRKFQVRAGCELSPLYTQEEGVPQGSVLSVALFAVAINGIVDVVPEGVQSSLFVDDFSISFAASRMSAAERRIQLTIDRVQRWVQERGFRFSSTKTVAMHFCRIRGVHPDPDLFLDGRRISCPQEVKFLGLTLDPRLTWVPHLRRVKGSCGQTLNLLRVLSHTKWGADRRTLLMLHRSLVLSKLEYGCELYSSATPARLRTLDSVHHSGLRLATGAFRTSPIPSLLVAAGEMGLERRRQSHVARTWYRVQRLSGSPTKDCISISTFHPFFDLHPGFPKPFSYRAREILADLSLPQTAVLCGNIPRLSPWDLPEVTYCRYTSGSRGESPDIFNKITFLEHQESHSDSMHVFTDGSKSEAGVGFGAVFPDFNKSGSLPKYAAVFSAELSAILLAIENIFTVRGRNFTIFSDSRAALQALESFNPSHPLIINILEWLYLLAQRGKQVNFCWVPAHVGVQGNERADELAKTAAGPLRPRPTPVYFRDYFSAVRAALYKSWQEEWDLQPMNKMREVTTSVSPAQTRMPRSLDVVLTRLRIGHTRHTNGYLLEGRPQPHCEDCIVPLTVRHLLIECPSLGGLRRIHFPEHRRADGSYSLSSLLGESACSPEGGIFKFLSSLDILTKL